MRLQGRNIAPLTLSSISSTPHSELADAVVAVRAREPRRRGPALRFTRAIPQQTRQDKMMRRRNCVAGDTYSKHGDDDGKLLCVKKKLHW